MSSAIQAFASLNTGITVPTWYNNQFPDHAVAILAHGLGIGNPQLKEHLKDRWVALATDGCTTTKSNVISYTARGHGQTYGWESTAESNLDQFTWQELAKDMVAVADHFQQERFIAGGQSMGCSTSLYAAIQHPERVMGLILIRPPTAWEERRSRRKFLLSAAERLRNELQPGSAEDGSTANSETDKSKEASVNAAGGIHPATDADLRLRNYHNVLKGTAYSDLPEKDSELYRRIGTIPTLILTIEGDPAHPVSTAETLHAVLPQSTLHIAPSKEAAAAAWPDLIANFVAAIQNS